MEKFKCGRCHADVVFKDEAELLASGFCNTALCVNCEQVERCTPAEIESLLEEVLEGEAFIDKCLRNQREFAELYNNGGGLIGVSSTGIHLKADKFKEVFGVGSDIERKDIGGYIRLKRTYKDVEVYALFNYPLNVNEIEL